MALVVEAHSAIHFTGDGKTGQHLRTGVAFLAKLPPLPQYQTRPSIASKAASGSRANPASPIDCNRRDVVAGIADHAIPTPFSRRDLEIHKATLSGHWS
jgi:hypothetical protein